MQTTSLALTIGEPAGIGPDIVLQLWQESPDWFLSQEITLIANKKLLSERAQLLGVSQNLNALSIIDIPLMGDVIPGKLNGVHADFVMQMLHYAAEKTAQGKFAGMITAPIHKGILNDAGFSIVGHTDFLSRYTQCKTVMMLMHQRLKVALLTDHVPLRAVPDFITPENIRDCLDILFHGLREQLGIDHPRIMVCGLNPHAGENGYLGVEENNIIIPVLNAYRKKGWQLMGPIGADVAFTPSMLAQADVVLSLYHDQGLPIIKYSGFHDAVNMTLGLPFVRTSVDHGTALDIAGTGKANTRSLRHAIQVARDAVQNKSKKVCYETSCT